jgi:Flp pilus assembly pilin Flp
MADFHEPKQAAQRLKTLANGLLGNVKGQDLVEYALMAGFVAVAAGAIMPGVSTNISKIFSSVASVLLNSRGTGS